MNERFQQLLKQSTNPPWDGEQGPMNEFNLERFAESIVKECMSLVSEPGPDMNDTERGILAQIREHFGVEE